MEHEKSILIYAICSADGLSAAKLLDHIYLVWLGLSLAATAILIVLDKVLILMDDDNV